MNQEINNLAYNITDITLSTISQIDKLVTKIECQIIPLKLIRKKIEYQIEEEIYSISIHLHLNKNIHVIKKIIKGQKLPEDKNEQIILNLKNVFEYIVKYNYEKKEIDLHEIIHLVKIIQNNIINDWELGVIRENYLINPNINNFLEPLELQKSIDIKDSLTHLLANLLKYINQENYVHPIIKAFKLTYFVQKTFPFLALNYLSSWILFRYVLTKFGYETNYKIPLLKILDFIELKEFINNVNKCNTTNLIEKISINMLTTINYYITKVNVNTEIIKNNCILNERQKFLLNHLKQHHNSNITKIKYAKMFNIAPMTAYRDLQDLMKKGLIQRQGQKKLTIYKIVE